MNRRITRKDIIRAVASVWGRPVEVILGASRAKEDVEPRQAAAYLMLEFGGYSSSEAAMALERERTTLVHAKQAIRKRLNEGDEELHRKIALVISELGLPPYERAKPPSASEDVAVPTVRDEVWVPEIDEFQMQRVRQLCERGWPSSAVCKSRPYLPARIVERLMEPAE